MLCSLSSMLGRGVNESRIVACTKIIFVPVLSGCLHGGSSLIFFFLSMFLMTTYLNQLKMYNFSNCTTEHCVGSIFCRVSHGVESPISAPNGPSLFLNLFNQLGLVLLPVGQNGWEQKLALVYKVSTCTVYRHAHVF